MLVPYAWTEMTSYTEIQTLSNKLSFSQFTKADSCHSNAGEEVCFGGILPYIYLAEF